MTTASTPSQARQSRRPPPPAKTRSQVIPARSADPRPTLPRRLNSRSSASRTCASAWRHGWPGPRHLDDVTFVVPAGWLFAVTGPSRSGKSTLLNLLTGLDRPSAGRTMFGSSELRGRSEDQLARWRGRNVGIVFQFFQLIPTLTVLENVMLALELGHATLPRRQWLERSFECLRVVGLTAQAGRLPALLSGGGQQRVAIAPGPGQRSAGRGRRRADRQSGLHHRRRASTSGAGPAQPSRP